MGCKKYDPPLWSILYPQLMDKVYLMRSYAQHKNSRGIAAEIGCSDRTVRNALKYHGIKRPFVVRKDEQ